MLTINAKEIPVQRMHAYLLGAVTPRPIAFASTIDGKGNVNLNPFSFFNCFGANPPLLVFSPARKGRDNTTKHTYENVRDVPEVVINVVTYEMVQQTSLASTEYERGVNEFVKAGFTPVASQLVKPPRVGESPIAMECKVLQVISTGNQGGAGNLVICEVLMMHINEKVIGDQGRIDPFKLDAVARLGGDYYARINGDSIFTVPKPVEKKGMGVDQIPLAIRNSKILSGNDLGMLGNVEQLPSVDAVDDEQFAVTIQKGEEDVHRAAKLLLSRGEVTRAWQLLLLSLKK